MRRLTSIMLILLVFIFTSSAQTTITLKLAFQHADYGIYKRGRVAINNQLLSTNDSGILRVVIPRAMNAVKISIPQSNNVLLYPADGHLPVPKDLREVPLIIVGKPEAHFQLKKYLDLLLLKENAKEEVVADVKRQVDSVRLQLFKNNISDDIVIKAERAAYEKKRYLTQVIANITSLRVAISEFKANYMYLAAHAFDDKVALDTLIESVNNYNNSYRKFERQHAQYEVMQPEYWSNAGVVDELRNYSDFLVNKVHAPCIYPMQEAILQIRQYFSGKKKNKTIRKTIELNTAVFIHNINKIIPELDNETNQLLADLTAN